MAYLKYFMLYIILIKYRLCFDVYYIYYIMNNSVNPMENKYVHIPQIYLAFPNGICLSHLNSREFKEVKIGFLSCKC